MMEGNELSIFTYFPPCIFLDVLSTLSFLTFSVCPSVERVWCEKAMTKIPWDADSQAWQCIEINWEL